jgi:hypothetical protein
MLHHSQSKGRPRKTLTYYNVIDQFEALFRLFIQKYNTALWKEDKSNLMCLLADKPYRPTSGFDKRNYFYLFI